MALEKYLRMQKAADKVLDRMHQKVRELREEAEKVPAVIAFREETENFRGLLEKYLPGQRVTKFQVFTGNGFIDLSTESGKEFRISLKALEFSPEQVRAHDTGNELELFLAEGKHARLCNALRAMEPIPTEGRGAWEESFLKAKEGLKEDIKKAAEEVLAIKRKPSVSRYVEERMF